MFLCLLSIHLHRLRPMVHLERPRVHNVQYSRYLRVGPLVGRTQYKLLSIVDVLLLFKLVLRVHYIVYCT